MFSEAMGLHKAIYQIIKNRNRTLTIYFTTYINHYYHISLCTFIVTLFGSNA